MKAIGAFLMPDTIQNGRNVNGLRVQKCIPNCTTPTTRTSEWARATDNCAQSFCDSLGVTSLFDNRALAIGAGVVLAAFAARAGDHKLLVVLRRSRAIVVRSLIVVVSVHGLYAKRRAIATK